MDEGEVAGVADLAGGARTPNTRRLEGEEVEERRRGCGVEGAGLAVGEEGVMGVAMLFKVGRSEACRLF